MLLPVDGIPLGERQSEFRRPNSNYYATRYLEARATTRMLVELGINGGVADVLRRDSPDVTVRYVDGRELYVEQAMVLDEEAHKFSIGVEDANASVWELAKQDAEASRALDSGLLTIRLNRIDLDRRFESAVVAQEVISLLKTLKERVDLMRADPARYPVLASMNVLIFYRPGDLKGGPIDTPAFHGRLGVFESAFGGVLEKKIGKAQRYSATCRPLWLLLTVDMHFDNSYHAQQVAQRVLSETDFSPYGRVVVQAVRLTPLVVDSSPGSNER